MGISAHVRARHVANRRTSPTERRSSRPGRSLPALGLDPGRFHLVVARFEPENNVDLMVEGYRRSGSTLPLVVVGSAPHASLYRARVVSSAGPNVRFLGAIWDQELLDQLYGNCASYLHGHSVGGTNPSLLRAMGAGAPIIAYDVVFNRETAEDAARYVRTATDVRQRSSMTNATGRRPPLEGHWVKPEQPATMSGTTSRTPTRRCANGWRRRRR